MNFKTAELVAAFIVWLGPAITLGDDGGSWSFAGHGKYRYQHTRAPADSVLRASSGANMQEHGAEARLQLGFRQQRWELDAHLQFAGLHSERLSGIDDLPALRTGGVINDKRRWFDLTHEISRGSDSSTLARVDRASIAYLGDKTVVRFGRQAVSWGSGLLFTPMDIFNPFDPAAVDKEYKTGDDMFYAQYLQDSGNDLQAVVVVRRDLVTGNVEQDESSIAVKYHGFLGSREYDLLLAEHYDERLVGLGFSTDLAGAIWRGDMVLTDTPEGSVFSAVAGASYSGILRGHNWTGFLEYFYNGHGQSSAYTPADLAGNPGLLQRLGRGELYNLGSHYLGASVTAELTPLVTLTPNIFVNLEDPSAMAQFVLAWDWRENFMLTTALSLPIGPKGSEYGGIQVEEGGPYLSTGVSLFAQLAWYF